MREIKFRAWDKESKKFSDLALNHPVKDIEFLTDYEWMQYTGFKDMNSKEIYEGDILYFEDECEFLGYVYWLDGAYWVSGVEEVLVDWNEACVVAGNIYEDVERYKQL